MLTWMPPWMVAKASVTPDLQRRWQHRRPPRQQLQLWWTAVPAAQQLRQQRQSCYSAAGTAAEGWQALRHQVQHSQLAAAQQDVLWPGVAWWPTSMGSQVAVIAAAAAAAAATQTPQRLLMLRVYLTHVHGLAPQLAATYAAPLTACPAAGSAAIAAAAPKWTAVMVPCPHAACRECHTVHASADDAAAQVHTTALQPATVAESA